MTQSACSNFTQKLLAACLVGGLPWASNACTVCVGDPDSPLTKGMVAGVLLLLAVILSVLVGIGCFFIYLARSSRQAAGTGADPYDLQSP